VSTEEIYQITLRVIAILEAMGVNYELGGSLASSVHGTPRSTLDADIVADLKTTHVAELIRRLGAEFYADDQVIENAIRAKKCFNVIHLGTMLKGEVAKRQYTDVLGVLRVTKSTLDLQYLQKWSETLGVKHLLDRALLEAGPLK
jgi:hypothetical protein